MNNVVTRALSGALYVATMISVIVCNEPIIFASVFAVVLALGLREFYTLCGGIKGVNPFSQVAIVGGLAAFLGSMWTEQAGLWVFLPVWLTLLIAEIYRKQENPMHNVCFEFGGLLYVALPFCCMSALFHLGNYYLLAFYIFVWVSDTGAYCAGKLLGKHKMIERISPKKTWEGTIGGLVFSMLAGYIASQLITGECNPLNLDTLGWMLLAAVSFTTGTLGDLVESVFKRYLGIKDSGNFLPGHGGVLDRFDSALLGAPAALALLKVVQLCAVA